MPRNISGLRRGGPGRPKGSVNQTTRDIQAFSRECLEDPKYIAALRERLREGRAPHMETLLAHYAYGKPKDTLDLRTTPPLMVVDELTAADVDAMTRDRES